MLVPFDFTDGLGSKWRPAVIVSSNSYNAETPDMLVASITGNLWAIPHLGDHQIQEWEAAGLLMRSFAQMKLAMIEATIIGRKLGSLAGSNMAALQRGLREALELE